MRQPCFHVAFLQLHNPFGSLRSDNYLARATLPSRRSQNLAYIAPSVFSVATVCKRRCPKWRPSLLPQLQRHSFPYLLVARAKQISCRSCARVQSHLAPVPEPGGYCHRRGNGREFAMILSRSAVRVWTYREYLSEEDTANRPGFPLFCPEP